MFIKIGNAVFNTDNIARIRKDEDGIDIDYNAGYNAGQLGATFRNDSPAYSEALAAYEWLCKEAIHFDIPAAEPVSTGDTVADNVAVSERYIMVTSKAHGEAREYAIADTVTNEIVYHALGDLEAIGIATLLNRLTVHLRQQLAIAQEQEAALDAELQKAQAHIGQILPANLGFAASALAYQKQIADLRKQLSREVEAHHRDVDELRAEIANADTD